MEHTKRNKVEVALDALGASVGSSANSSSTRSSSGNGSGSFGSGSYSSSSQDFNR